VAVRPIRVAGRDKFGERNKSLQKRKRQGGTTRGRQERFSSEGGTDEKKLFLKRVLERAGGMVKGTLILYHPEIGLELKDRPHRKERQRHKEQRHKVTKSTRGECHSLQKNIGTLFVDTIHYRY